MKHASQFSFRSASQLLALCACAAVLGGCASAITSESLVPAGITAGKKHSGTVSVAVDGGKETDSMGKPQISNDAMRKALADAITKSQTFSKVIEGSGGRYLLTVSMYTLDQPSFGASFTVKMEAGWTLKRADTGATVWQESIRSEHTATMGDAMAGVTRLRLATEGAARNNIANGLAKISQLNL
jgi:hypothetical protein